VTYTAALSGNVDVDPDDGTTGLFALSWASPGSQQAFEFTPNTTAGVSAAGTLIVDPLDLGADAYGDTLTSDFEFAIVGDVTFTYPTGGAVVFRTGRPIAQARIAPPAADEPAPAAAPVPA
jgi:hypothetical protein